MRNPSTVFFFFIAPHFLPFFFFHLVPPSLNSVRRGGRFSTSSSEWTATASLLLTECLLLLGLGMSAGECHVLAFHADNCNLKHSMLQYFDAIVPRTKSHGNLSKLSMYLRYRHHHILSSPKNRIIPLPCSLFWSFYLI